MIYSDCSDVALVIFAVFLTRTLDFGVSHMDGAGREALAALKPLTAKTVKSQVVWCLLNKAALAAILLCRSADSHQVSHVTSSDRLCLHRGECASKRSGSVLCTQ